MGLRTILRNIKNGNIYRSRKSYYDRNSFLKSIPKELKILEIGPFFNPVHKGEKVKYFDIENREDLVVRAKELDPTFKVENIPYIDYVSPSADLTIIKEIFEAIYSSHVIEHQFDLIDHLQKTSDLLPVGGKYYLIVPDKRYCFDHFQQISTIADVISAHFEKRKKHTLKSLLEHRVLATHNDPVLHWKGNHGKLTDKVIKIKKAIAEYEERDLIDTHAFYFTPDTFIEIMNLLYELDYINFKVERIHKTPKNNFEFYCVLEKTES